MGHYRWARTPPPSCGLAQHGAPRGHRCDRSGRWPGGSRARRAGGRPAARRARPRTSSPRLPGDAVPTALEGVDVVVMISGSDAADRIEHPRSFIEGARQAGLACVVGASLLGASPDAVFTLTRPLGDRGVAGVERDGLHAAGRQLLRRRHAGLRRRRRPRGPAGDGAVRLLTVADVAEVALAVLRDPAARSDAAYGPTGHAAPSSSTWRACSPRRPDAP